MIRNNERPSRLSAACGVTLAAGMLLGPSAIGGELAVSIDPSPPKSNQVFNLSAIFYDFGDPGQEVAEQSLSINGSQIDVYVRMRDLHAPGVYFPQVLTPDGATFGMVGPLAAGTYHVDAELWIERPYHFPPRAPSLFATGQLIFRVLASGTSAVPGDYNGDATVNSADYTVWRNTRGQAGQGLRADGTGPGGEPDGVVDEFDFMFWKTNFGDSASSVSAQAATNVPEPNALPLLILAGCFARRPFRRVCVAGR